MAEKEYIEREAVINHIDFVVDNAIDTDYQKAAWGFGVFVSRLPAADVVPVRHGHWIEQENWIPDDYYYTCSACGEDYNTIDGTPDYNFCPNCGASMTNSR